MQEALPNGGLLHFRIKSLLFHPALRGKGFRGLVIHSPSHIGQMFSQANYLGCIAILVVVPCVNNYARSVLRNYSCLAVDLAAVAIADQSLDTISSEIEKSICSTSLP